MNMLCMTWQVDIDIIVCSSSYLRDSCCVTKLSRNSMYALHTATSGL